MNRLCNVISAITLLGVSAASAGTLNYKLSEVETDSSLISDYGKGMGGCVLDTIRHIKKTFKKQAPRFSVSYPSEQDDSPRFEFVSPNGKFKAYCAEEEMGFHDDETEDGEFRRYTDSFKYWK